MRETILEGKIFSYSSPPTELNRLSLLSTLTEDMGLFGQSNNQVPSTMLVRAQDPYQYGTLDQEGRQMRVLTLLPSINTKAEITCTLALAGVDQPSKL